VTIKLKRFLEELLEGYSDEAPEDATYPYKVFSIRKLVAEDGISSYMLEVNVWDKHRYYSRAESVMDKLEKLLNKQVFNTQDLVIYTYIGQRDNIVDQDKQIKRVRGQFEIRVVSKEE
jgi:hypothetical protein